METPTNIELAESIAEIILKIAEQDELRHEMDRKLDKVNKQAQKNYNMFIEHDTKEMEKYQETIDAINKLTTTMEALLEDTNDNTGYIKSKRYEEKLEKRVQEELNKQNAPTQEVWRKAKLTAVWVITVSVLSGIGAALKFGFDIYIMLHGGQ